MQVTNNNVALKDRVGRARETRDGTLTDMKNRRRTYKYPIASSRVHPAPVVECTLRKY